MAYEVISLDTGLLIAALNPKDVHHEAAVGFLEAFRLRTVFSTLDGPWVWELAAERFSRMPKTGGGPGAGNRGGSWRTF